MEDGNVKATLDMLAGLGLDVRVMRETPFLAVVENPAIPSRRVAVAVPDGDGPARAELARRTGVAATRISEYARPRPGRADPANMTLRTARALARALGVTIDALYDTMAMRIPENGPTARQAGTSDPARRA